MFSVRTPRACRARCQVGSSVHAACTATAPSTPSRLSPPCVALHVRLGFTRQGASAFNQPLSFDTSRVTEMNHMFIVRSARALPPRSLESEGSIASAVAPSPPHVLPPLNSARTSPHIAPCLPSTRQRASAFNQPLSFDTSSVTTMEEMFEVHSTRALSPDSSQTFPCTLRARPPPLGDLPASYVPPF